jgi:hypothetical protein
MAEIECKISDVPVCDFCSSKEPAWEYSAEDFLDGEDTGVVQKSVGGWLACDACANRIEKKDWRGLAERGMDTPAAQLLEMVAGREEAIAEMMRFQAKFRDHRNRKVTRYVRGAA